MKYSSLTWIAIIILLAACDSGSQRRIKREALQEEIRNREPKKLSEAQIIDEAFRQGRLISEEAQKELFSTLEKILNEAGPATAVQYCNIQAYPLTDSLSSKFNAEIRRTSLRTRNPLNAPSEIETQLLEAYEYNEDNQLPMEDNVQRLDREHFLYTRPIVLNNELCLNCHGEPAKDIEHETLKRVDSLYPQDKARNYKLGELRGMWSIKLDQKDLVNAL